MQEEQWTAIVASDPSYDGHFLYAVKTTKVFCRPSCKSRTPNRKNVDVFMTAEAAREAGYRPCKRCGPDQYRLPSEELAHRAMEYMDAHYHQSLTLTLIAQSLHISPHHLHHIFKRVAGMTPVEYLLQKRIREAKRLFEETNLNVTEVALACGFSNAAHFSTVFRKEVGVPPSSYRVPPSSYRCRK